MIESTSSWTNASAVEAELLDGKRRHRRKEIGAGHIRMFREPGLEPAGDAAGLWHSTDPGGMLHHAFALGHRELPKQEKSLAGRGRDPVGIAAAGVQESGLSGFGCCLGEIDQFVLDFERTEGLEFLQRHKVGHDLLLLFAGFRRRDVKEVDERGPAGSGSPGFFATRPAASRAPCPRRSAAYFRRHR